MQRAHGVGHRREWVAHVVLQVAGQTRLLHDEHATRRERRMDAFQHARWVGLVVDSVEHEHNIQ